MSDNQLFQPDRRKQLRNEATDRREGPRSSVKLRLLKVIATIVAVLVVGFIVYVINPKI